MVTRFQLTVDCIESARLVRFWSEALGYTEEPEGNEFCLH